MSKYVLEEEKKCYPPLIMTFAIGNEKVKGGFTFSDKNPDKICFINSSHKTPTDHVFD